MSEDSLHFCYLDESGVDGELKTGGPDVSPVFVLAGIIVAAREVPRLTGEFLDAKRRFFPERFGDVSSPDRLIRGEVRGASLLGMLNSGFEKQEKQVLGFMGASFNLLDRLGARLVGRVLVKETDRPIKKTNDYIASLNIIAGRFQRFLAVHNARGMIILDNRNNKNARPNPAVSHGFFTKKFRDSDKYPNIAESPMFVDSQNHAGIQIADLFCSGLVAPIAAAAYCGRLESGHVRPENLRLRELFGERMLRLQFRFLDDREDGGGKWRDGLTVSGPAGDLLGNLLFHPAEEGKRAG